MDKGDPTDVRRVVAALKNSKKLTHWHKGPREFGPDNPEDSEYNRNDLKWVGDMSKTALSPGFSFCAARDTSDHGSDGEDNDDTRDLPNILQLCNSKGEWAVDDVGVVGAEEGGVAWRNEALEVGRKAQYAQHLVDRMEDLKLHEQIQADIKRKCQQKYAEYMAGLADIYRSAEARKLQYFADRNNSLLREENQLRQREEEEAKLVQKQGEEYGQFALAESQRLVAIVEAAERREAEQASQLRAMMAHLQDSHHALVAKVAQMHQHLSTLQDGQEVDPEGFLDETLTQVAAVMGQAADGGLTQDHILNTTNTVSIAIAYVDDTNNTLRVQVEERKKQEEKAKVENEAAEAAKKQQEQAAAAAATAATAPTATITTETPAVKVEQTTPQQPAEVTHPIILIVRSGKKRLAELHEKVRPFLAAQEQLDGRKRMALNKATTAINQLSLTSHSINRDKMQGLLKLVSGRPVQVAGQNLSVDGDAVALAYVKNYLASMIVKLGHDKQSGGGVGVAAYAWVMAELVAIYPDMWDLFLYHVYETCPYLVPCYPVKEDGQTEEEFEKARGMYKKEKEDAFMGRMANASLLFGLVLYKLHAKPNCASLKAPVLGWELLAKTFAMPPTSGLTPGVLHSFLGGFGVTLQAVYGKQFLKLMEYLSTAFMPELETATTMGGAQSLDQLKKCLAAFRRSRTLPKHQHADKFK